MHAAIRETIDAVVEEVSQVVIGQTPLIKKLLIALLADGHVLLEGAPGLAKTQLISALGKATGGTFRRIQLLHRLANADRRRHGARRFQILDARGRSSGAA